MIGWDTVVGFFTSLLARVFKDWRRDQALEEKGATDQRNANLEESEARRKDADQIVREAEGDSVIVKDDEL